MITRDKREAVYLSVLKVFCVNLDFSLHSKNDLWKGVGKFVFYLFTKIYILNFVILIIRDPNRFYYKAKIYIFFQVKKLCMSSLLKL